MSSTGLSDVWMDQPDCSIEEFRAAVEKTTDADMVPFADEIASRVPVYDGDKIRSRFGDARQTKAYMAEWNRVFADGPGIIAIRKAFDDPGVIDQVTEVLNGIAEEEQKAQAGSGDHFAAAGANTRIWNAHEKLCMASPELFARYNAGHIVPLVSKSWLGPRYQITTQVNIVRPGGSAQTSHRDYHMGFMTLEDMLAYPLSVHVLSAGLTLQGGVAHADTPIVSGPTKLLPFSQTYARGYVGALLPEFRSYFEDNFIQLAMAKGDAVFFNPAVFHAAGENRSADIHRFVNLMQIGSGFGRSIEIVSRTAMSIALFPVLQQLSSSGALTSAQVDNVVEACAEGYPFPVNLDIDSPLSGMAPPSQQDVMRQALAEGWAATRFVEEVTAQSDRRRPN